MTPRRCGPTSSEARVTAQTTAAPRPSPVTKRYAKSTARVPGAGVASVNIAKTTTAGTNTALRPKRSDHGASARLPAASPATAAENTSPSADAGRFIVLAIDGAARP